MIRSGGRGAMAAAWLSLVFLGACGERPRAPDTQRSAPADPPVATGYRLDFLQAASDAIVEMELNRARQLLGGVPGALLEVAQSEALATLRTRLSLYAGDCDAAAAIVASLPQEVESVAPLAAVASRCSAAVAGAHIVEDTERGVWLRFQDAADLPLAPFIARVAARARDAVARDIGVRLPRPLRIDVVRDLFSLSAVSGLPVEAAETTGTVAVARWGRVTFLSPSASLHGFPWEDTMAHELVHLALARATHDYAPLWLQEGVAKREEYLWRAPRPLDEPSRYDRLALAALLDDESVGVDQLGPSIAMLPSARAANIAFSEVTSFIDYWIATNGTPAFRLLLADLRGLRQRDADRALRSVTGAPLSAWIDRWRLHLLSQLESLDASPEGPEAVNLRGLSRNLRLGDLLSDREHFEAAVAHLKRSLATVDRIELRGRAAKAALRAGVPSDRAAELLGRLSPGAHPDGEWFALHARLAPELSDQQRQSELSTAISSLPWSAVVACQGAVGDEPPPASLDPAWAKLCAAARKRPRPR